MITKQDITRLIDNCFYGVNESKAGPIFREELDEHGYPLINNFGWRAFEITLNQCCTVTCNLELQREHFKGQEELKKNG